MKEKIIKFGNDPVLEGVLRTPDSKCKDLVSVLLIHGSLEHDRDGRILVTRDDRALPDRTFFLEISKHLTEAGFAVFSWDRRGFGESGGTPGSYQTDVQDAKLAFDALLTQPEIDRDKMVIFGQSAGVYTASLMAREGCTPFAFILSGGLSSDYEDMLKFNYHRVRDYAAQSELNRKWVEKNDLWGLAFGTNLDHIIKELKDGKDRTTIKYKKSEWPLQLNREVYSEDLSPRNQFRFINAPTLIVHGRKDLNVPVEDAIVIKDILQKNGIETQMAMIENADHSFQIPSTDEDTRLRERMSLSCLKHPYEDKYFRTLINFLKGRMENIA